jgi:hypothetical protein
MGNAHMHSMHPFELELIRCIQCSLNACALPVASDAAYELQLAPGVQPLAVPSCWQQHMVLALKKCGTSHADAMRLPANHLAAIAGLSLDLDCCPLLRVARAW